MYTYDQDERLDDHLGRRLARSGVGVAAAGLFLAGYLVQPAWIFLLSALSIYLTVTAILGGGLTAAFRPAATGLPEAPTVRQPVTVRERGPDAVKEEAA